MKIARCDGDEWRIIILFDKDDTQPSFVKIKGKKFHKLAELKLKAKEKELWDSGFIYERKKWE